MTRTQRLLELMQLLRAYRYPVTALILAEKLNISVRTLYRDIQTLQQQGVEIEGSAGVGYRLKSDYLLSALMFNQQEVEALSLGLDWVSCHTDPELQKAAKEARVKIHSLLPDKLAHGIEYPSLMIASEGSDQLHEVMPEIRRAIRQRRKLKFTYRDKDDVVSSRLVWPVAVGFFNSVRILAGWCELRQAFRHFRLDRMISVQVMPQQYPNSRHQLLKAWREDENMLEKQTY
ncbi:helix-turn-helix transcriptional regulator [Serratia microhaemolytica]|uniref:helix-turn-helix transcriptional regulator n=1 Tax=Serratia microhaemolytica TaxID=2675110 RepID=UPI000FDCE26A|nr:YafY family protein [Serratia microhaemolytica]